MLKLFYTIALITLLTNIQNITYASDYNIFSEEEDIEEEELYDPFEKFNRKIYSFNTTLDKYTLKPIAKAYRKTIPTPIRTSIGNVLTNLTTPLTAANSILQLNFKNAGKSVLRFTINSTIGILGIFDVATKMNIEISKEDLGQTFAKYHIPEGPYLMVPFLGPFTLRSLTGFGIEWQFNPIWHDIDDTTQNQNIRYGIAAFDIIHKREKIHDELEDITNNTLDPYSVIKSAYIQNRRSLVNNSKTTKQN